MLVPYDVRGRPAVVRDDRHAAGQRLVHGRCVDLLLARLQQHVEGGQAAGSLEPGGVRQHLGAGGPQHLRAAAVAEDHQPHTGQPRRGVEAVEHLRAVEVSDVAGDEPVAVERVHPRPAVVQLLVAQAGVVVRQVDAGLPAAGVQHHGRYAEPVGRLGDLEAQPVRVDEVADVGPGESHRLPDRRRPGSSGSPRTGGRRRSVAWPRPAAKTVTSCPRSIRRDRTSRVTWAEGSVLGANCSVTSAMRMGPPCTRAVTRRCPWGEWEMNSRRELDVGLRPRRASPCRQTSWRRSPLGAVGSGSGR